MEAEQYFTRSTRKFKEKDSYAMLRSGLQTKYNDHPPFTQFPH